MKIMNRIVLVLLVLLTFSNTYGQEKGFSVKGKIEGLKNGSMTVIYTGPDQDQHKADTIEIKNHKFLYQGFAKEPKYVFILVNDLDEHKRKAFGFPMFLDNSKVTINADVKNLGAAKIKGSKLTDNYNDLIAKTDLFKLLGKNEAELRKANEKKDIKQSEVLKKDQENYVDNILAYLESTPGFNHNMAVAYLVYDRIGRYLKGDRLLEVLDKYSPKVNQSVYFSYLRRDVLSEKRLALGNPAPDFALFDLAGKTHSLKDYQGEYVLLDFGASWCYWCKKEKPFLLDVHEKYKNKGLKVINISMDKKREDWEKDIQKENYPWISISDLKAWSGAVAKDYNIKGIPNIMLIDKNGKIVAKNLRGAEIEQTISKYLFSAKVADGFQINGRIKGLPSGKVYLVFNAAKDKKIIDSAIVTNERFVFKGKVAEPLVYQLQVPRQYFEGMASFSPSTSIFIENSEISFEGKLDSLDHAIVKGSVIHDEYQNFLNTAEPLVSMKELERKGYLAYKNKELDLWKDYFAQRDRIEYKVYPEYLLSNVEKFKNSKAFAYIFYKELDMADWKIRENVIKHFSDDLQDCFYVKQIKADIEKYKSVAVGTQAPNFSLPDVNGMQVKLSDFRGKYVLIDFWASWCGPCRRETPNIKSAYEKYKHKGFEIIAVSLDKKSQEKEWRKAIEEDKANWIQLASLTPDGGCPAAKQYNVKAIPHCVLVDKNGKIIAKDLRGKDFDNELSKIFSN